MSNAFKGDNLARRYLYATIAIALIPLLLIAGIYDRYSKQLIDTIYESRIEGNLDSVAAQMNSVLTGQVNRLENIVDLAETASYFLEQPNPISDHLLDFLLLEAESADIYAIELYNTDDVVVATVPVTGVDWRSLKTTTPHVLHAQTEVIGPILPTYSQPGWFLLRQPVIVNQVKLGSVALRMRLASLTEQMSSLSEPGVFLPQLTIFNRIHLSPTATEASPGKLLYRSQKVLPGWHVDMVTADQNLGAPRQHIRTFLLGIAVLLAIMLSILFLRMSRRLDSFLEPLREGAEAVARGDFTTKIEEDGPGELGTLARAFNSMRGQLRGMINSRVDTERRATLGNMAAGIAHEIRNPLATVNTAIYGLRASEHEPERLEMYEEIGDEIDRVDGTISEFLNYARPSPPNPEWVEVREVFQSLQILTAAQLLESNVVLNLTGESGLCLKVDQAHLRQILLNLVLNACDAMPEGGTITLCVFRDKQSVIVDVADTGVGIDEETLAHILRPFFTTKPGGTGLGLPITAELARSNGGTLDVNSVPGAGTHVTVTFESQRGKP